MELDVIVQKLELIQTEIGNLVDGLKQQPVAPPIEVIEDTPTRGPVKRALIVGVNKYAPSLNCDLNGCVNDANNIRSILTRNFQFPESNITVLTDFDATKANIMAGLDALVSNTISGDTLVFSFSGHGSQVPDISGDELDKMDEIICTTDLDWNDPFTDDLLATYFKRVPTGVMLSFICDSCHSGTVSRSITPSKGSKEGTRFLDPPAEIKSKADGKTLPLNKFGQKVTVGVTDQRHILFAGCAEDNYSYEGYFNNKVQGAFTWNLCKVVRLYPNTIWKIVDDKVTVRLASQGFPQIPQLVTDPSNITLELFKANG